MATLAAVVADLLARPRPILCLDTCDLLDIIQCVAEGQSWRLEHVRHLLDTLAANPDSVQLVGSYLVPVEWTQNLAAVIADLEQTTRHLDKAVADIYLAWMHINAPLPEQPPVYSGKGLALETMANGVLGRIAILDRDDACVSRALDRVHHKVRPSHAGMVKDSIHLEHYLDLSRLLQTAGYGRRRVFVSANKADFWETRQKAVIHPDLKPQLDAVGLEFFGTLEAAMGSLGI